MKYELCILFVALASVCHALPNGTVYAACDDMTPQHGMHKPQTDDPPYMITAEKGDDGKYMVTLEPTEEGGFFGGFLLQAHCPCNERKGQFGPAPEGTQLLDCSSPGDSVSHTSPVNKTSITVAWDRGDFKGNVTFVATVVQSYPTFWLNVTSEMMRLS